MAAVSSSRANPSLAQLPLAFARRRVLLVGDLVADHYIYGQTDRVSREAPVLIVRHESSEVKLGGGANVAANVRALSGQVTVVGLLGADEMGRALRGLFDEAGARLSVVSARGVETETKTRILAGGMSTTRQQMLRLDRGQRGDLPPKLRRALVKRVEEAARDVDAVVVSDYGAGVVGDEMREALRRLAAEGLPVCVDSRYSLASFTGLTVCKPNEPELQSLVGRPLRTEAELVEAGHEARRRLECRALLVTRGRHGMMLFDEKGALERLPVHGAKEAVDVTGAGDTVIAAFALGLAAGGGYGDAARLANVAGALAVQKLGTATVARDELLNELKGAR
ncbi:bifunctional heptose 7-phosphate kinase/heptose 1-phosphate adenyltransferase [Archangium primigenium]|uniref:bifunctional heptose 7-phosphate kinase/heptose 1-phosphate adenyltransferase n=1 Tax=[Archangium] primigenium TaxID=2792470 RepID=UPI00195D7430|nr:bifunctional ADP-heptose synthase [Archangium primigenium]MBM7117531.1 bifunctional hydroxymethylpyrimidine kinase/phosphomethylpyrimidine kinase [Archangium primigenium]